VVSTMGISETLMSARVQGSARGLLPPAPTPQHWLHAHSHVKGLLSQCAPSLGQ
jgi:hypothetical protein